MRPLLFGVLLVLSAITSSCAPPSASFDRWGAVEGEDYIIKIDDKGESGFRAFLPDNSMFSKSESYARAIPSIVQEVAEKGGRVVFVIEDPECGGSYETGSGYAEQSQCLNVRGNERLPFSFRFSYELRDEKWIGGCVREDCTPGGALRLHRNGSQLADVHIGRFYRGGRSCLGIYESESGWCTDPCTPTQTDLKRGIRDAALAVGAAAAVAWLTAEAAAPIFAPVVLVL